MCTSSALRVGAAAGPRATDQRVAPDDRAEPLDERRASARSTGESVTQRPAVAQQAVVVDIRCGDRLAGPGRERRHPCAEVVLRRGEADPVLERVDRRRGGQVLADEEEARGAGGTEALEAGLLLGPPDEDDLVAALCVHHAENVRTSCFSFISPW